jgi:hypothetical protein
MWGSRTFHMELMEGRNERNGNNDLGNTINGLIFFPKPQNTLFSL